MLGMLPPAWLSCSLCFVLNPSAPVLCHWWCLAQRLVGLGAPRPAPGCGEAGREGSQPGLSHGAGACQALSSSSTKAPAFLRALAAWGYLGLDWPLTQRWNFTIHGMPQQGRRITPP